MKLKNFLIFLLPPVFAVGIARANTTAPEYSKDKQFSVYVDADPPKYVEEGYASPQPATIILENIKTGKKRQLFPKGKRIVMPGIGVTLIERVQDMCFSEGNRELYFLCNAWMTSGAILAVNLNTNKVRFVCDGNSVRIVESGKWKGNLIVNQHKYNIGKKGGSYDWDYVIGPTGKQLAVYNK